MLKPCKCTDNNTILPYLYEIANRGSLDYASLTYGNIVTNLDRIKAEYSALSFSKAQSG